MNLRFPLAKNLLTSLAKSMMIPLGLTTAASAADAEIQEKSWGLELLVQEQH